ncbi:hypothetical protein pb186bvf_007823 [Paramecium bursaria]
MQYKPIETQLDVLEDDGELDQVTPRTQRPKSKGKLIFLLIFMFVSSLFYLIWKMQELGQPNNININIPRDRTKDIPFDEEIEIPIKKQNITKGQVIQDEPKPQEFNIDEIVSERSQVVYSDTYTERGEEEVIQSESEESVKETEKIDIKKNETKKIDFEDIQNQLAQKLKEQQESQGICKSGHYYDGEMCQQCQANCKACQHLEGSCYLCDDQYSINEQGKCVLNCTQRQNIFMNGNSSKICFKCENASFYLSHQKSNQTSFVLPYLIIHPTIDLATLYKHKFPILYYFNKDLFNFNRLNIQDIINLSIENQIIVIIIASGTLYDYPLFNSFLMKHAQIEIEDIIKQRSDQFVAFYGSEEDGYGAMRQYQAQYKENGVDLLIVDRPQSIDHYKLERNQKLTHEQHISDPDMMSIVGALSPKTTIIILSNDFNRQVCGYIQCQNRDPNQEQSEILKQVFQLVGQFIYQDN